MTSPWPLAVEALGVSTSVVALGELGDKTQLLAIVLAARYRRVAPIVWGILVATLANHALASALGAWLAHAVNPAWMRWGLGLSFIAVAAWMLVPDQLDDSQAAPAATGSIFFITTLSFFVAEMGDKTQIATVMLAAKYQQWFWVTTGTTLGMMLANVPAVLLGERVVQWVPMVWVHRVAALIFACLGLVVLFTT